MAFNLTEQEVDQQYNDLHKLPGQDYRNAALLGCNIQCEIERRTVGECDRHKINRCPSCFGPHPAHADTLCRCWKEDWGDGEKFGEYALGFRGRKQCKRMSPEDESHQQYETLHELPGKDYRNAAPIGCDFLCEVERRREGMCVRHRVNRCPRCFGPHPADACAQCRCWRENWTDVDEFGEYALGFEKQYLNLNFSKHSTSCSSMLECISLLLNSPDFIRLIAEESGDSESGLSEVSKNSDGIFAFAPSATEYSSEKVMDTLSKNSDSLFSSLCSTPPELLQSNDAIVTKTPSSNSSLHSSDDEGLMACGYSKFL